MSLTPQVLVAIVAGLTRASFTVIGEATTRRALAALRSKPGEVIGTISEGDLILEEATKVELSAQLGQVTREAEDAVQAARNLLGLINSPEFSAIFRQTCAIFALHGSQSIAKMAREPFKLAVQAAGLRSAEVDTDLVYSIYCTTATKYLNELWPELPKRRRDAEAFDELATAQLHSLIRLAHVQSEQDQGQPPHEFADAIRPMIANEFTTIATPHWEAIQRVPLKDVFVAPQIDGQSDRVTPLPLHLLIKGDPGGGKTTFARELALELTTNPSSTRHGDATPNNVFFITLREYQATEARTFISYIEEDLSRFSRPPTDAVETLLLAGSTCVIFDGLDELLDPMNRQKIVDSIEVFALRFPNAPILVTSRSVGYNEAPLTSRFVDWQIGGFRDSVEVPEYVRRFFATHPNVDARDTEAVASKFLDTSRTVSDLRVNPLLLALLCNLFHATNFQDLPRTRAGVYEKCALTLYDRWDRRRSIVATEVDFDRDFLPTISAVAHGLFSDDQNEDGISEPQLVSRCVQFLWTRKYEDRDEAVAFASELIQHCTGRSWVMRDVGLDVNGEALFAFTHRTFLEFFAAKHLARSHYNPAKLVSGLSRELVMSGSIVADLALEMKARELDDGASIILNQLVARADRDRAMAPGLLALACRGVSNFSAPEVSIKRVITACLPMWNGGELDEEYARTLANAVGDNQRSVAIAFRTVFEESLTHVQELTIEHPELWESLKPYRKRFARLDIAHGGFWGF